MAVLGLKKYLRYLLRLALPLVHAVMRIALQGGEQI